MAISKEQEYLLAKAALIGVETSYYDFGHPERYRARKYWTASDGANVIGYGHTEQEAVLDWIRRRGFK